MASQLILSSMKHHWGVYEQESSVTNIRLSGLITGLAIIAGNEQFSQIILFLLRTKWIWSHFLVDIVVPYCCRLHLYTSQGFTEDGLN